MDLAEQFYKFSDNMLELLEKKFLWLIGLLLVVVYFILKILGVV